MDNNDNLYLAAAIAQAKKSLGEGGIPIGAALAIDDTLVGEGHNRRVQQNDAILHAEIDCIRNAGRLTPAEYRRGTLYSTLSPCPMCSGAILLFGIPRIVIGENVNFTGSEKLLASKGVEVIQAKNAEIEAILGQFIQNNKELWFEDIGRAEG